MRRGVCKASARRASFCRVRLAACGEPPGCSKTSPRFMFTTPKIVPKPVIVGFFLLGLLSSVAFRAIILLQKYRPGWVRSVWYFGVLGYMAFFMYRYYISHRRKRA